LIAKKADGAMRDALSIFDQIRAATSGEVTGARVREVLNIIDQEFFFRATDIIHAQDRKAVFAYTAELIDRGIDIQEFIAGFIDHLRNILFAATTQSASLIETTQFFQQRYLAEGKKFSEQDALRLLNIAIETDQSLRFAQQPRVHLEFALLRMASMPQSIDLQQLLNELREQKKNPVTRPVDPPASNDNAVSHTRRETAPPAPATQKASVQSTQSSQSSEPKVVYSTAEPTEAWRQLIATARERRIRCWSTLEHNTIFLGIQSSAIKIAFSEEFHRDQCKRYIADLNALAKEILGAGYSFAIQEELAAENSSEPSPAATTATAPVGNTQSGDALAELLAREFGAEEIR
ncbi:MAG TPA: hypothetical protein VFJ29_05875, partial [Candidatus Kapabacteria bacterium]|nr:hypothetical protein [Candidatus Kapabacteria bacterium]